MLWVRLETFQALLEQHKTQQTEVNTMSFDLSEKAMLVTLSIGFWSGSKLDKEVTDHVHAEYAADSDSGKYNKYLVPKVALDPVKKAITRAREYHKKHTLPWKDCGVRLLPSAHYLEYTQGIRACFNEVDQEADRFFSIYPDLVNVAQSRLNGMFRSSDYPDVSQLRGRYYRNVEVEPLPSGNDFRVNLSAEETKAIQAEIETRTQLKVREATRDLWDRLHKGVSRMADRLTDNQGEPGKPQRFTSTVVTSLLDLVNLLPALNLTGDQNLERMRREIEAKLTKIPAEDLREDPVARADVKRSADDILKAMAGYCG